MTDVEATAQLIAALVGLGPFRPVVDVGVVTVDKAGTTATANLRTMMRAVVTDGGAGFLRDLSGPGASKLEVVRREVWSAVVGPTPKEPGAPHD